MGPSASSAARRGRHAGRSSIRLRENPERDAQRMSKRPQLSFERPDFVDEVNFSRPVIRATGPNARRKQAKYTSGTVHIQLKIDFPHWYSPVDELAGRASGRWIACARGRGRTCLPRGQRRPELPLRRIRRTRPRHTFGTSSAWISHALHLEHLRRAVCVLA